jgi:hypothetical protein
MASRQVLGYQGRRWLLCTTGRKVLPALSLVGPVAYGWRRPRCPCDDAVAVQNCPGEGASCRVLVSTTPSRPWNGLPRGRLRLTCLPRERLLVRPLLLPAMRAAFPPARGGCWPRCAPASAAPLPRLAGAAGGRAALPGRTEHPPPGTSRGCIYQSIALSLRMRRGDDALTYVCDRVQDRASSPVTQHRYNLGGGRCGC